MSLAALPDTPDPTTTGPSTTTVNDIAADDTAHRGLNPAQRAVLEALGAPARDRPVFDPALRHELLSMLDDGLAPAVDLLDELDQRDALYVTKHALATVHGCEGRFLADDRDMPAWTPARARGVVAHKAIELLVHWRGQPTPLELIDEAIARLTERDSSLGTWLQSVSDAERAELRGAANDRLSKFIECWPPLRRQWRPVTESRLRFELANGRVVLAGKSDLTLGQPTGTTAGKVIVDLKSGGFAPHHLDDVRFYALLETLRLGVPPRRVATSYLDSGQLLSEDVTEGVLLAAAARTIDGVGRMVALRTEGVEPVLRPGPSCRWCPLLATCETGARWIDDGDTTLD